jgi:hypothetical protein
MALPGLALLIFGILSAFTATYNALYPRLSFLECLFIAPGLGLSATAWVALLLKSLPFVRKGVAPEVVFGTLCVQLLVVALTAPSALKKLRKEKLTAPLGEVTTHRAALRMLAAMSAWWYYMSYIHYLLPRGSEHLTGGSVYADLPFHLNITTSFLNGCNEWATIFSSLMSSFFAGVTLAYPFMPDFFLAVLAAGGLTLRWALVLTSWILLSSLFSLIHMLNFRLSGSVRVGMLSVWLTLFAGGIGAFYYVADEPLWWTWDKLTNSKFMHGPDHVLYWVRGMSAYWFSLPAHILFPQRTVQHAYPLAVSALIVVWAGMMGTPPPPPAEAAAEGAEGAATGEHRKAEEMARATAAPVVGAAGADADDGEEVKGLADQKGLRFRGRGGGAAGGGAGGGGGGGGGGDAADDGGDGKRKPRPVAPAEAAAATKELWTFGAQSRLFAFAGFLMGLIPLMQPHSYVSIGVILLVAAGFQVATMFVETLCRGGPRAPVNGAPPPAGAPRWAPLLNAVALWVVFGAVAISMGAPQFLKHFMHRISFGVGTRGNGFVRWSTAWAEEGKGETPCAWQRGARIIRPPPIRATHAALPSFPFSIVSASPA